MKSDKGFPRKGAWVSYLLLMTASAGYYGYYVDRADAMIIQWILLGAAGAALLCCKNFRVRRWRCMACDLINCLCMALIPRIPLPHGLSILAMAVLCSMLSVLGMKLSGYYSE